MKNNTIENKIFMLLTENFAFSLYSLKIPLSPFSKGEFIIDFSKEGNPQSIKGINPKNSREEILKVSLYRGDLVVFKGQVMSYPHMFLYMSELLSEAKEKN